MFCGGKLSSFHTTQTAHISCMPIRQVFRVYPSWHASSRVNTVPRLKKGDYFPPSGTLLNAQLKKKRSQSLDKGLLQFEWISNLKAKSTNHSENPREWENSPTDHPIWLIAVCVEGKKKRKQGEEGEEKKISHGNLPSPCFFLCSGPHWSSALIMSRQTACCVCW